MCHLTPDEIMNEMVFINQILINDQACSEYHSIHRSITYQYSDCRNKIQLDGNYFTSIQRCNGEADSKQT